jgi:rhodanese-related sulfurtransferase
MMKPIRQLKKMCNTFRSSTRIVVAVLALAILLAWLPAWAGQPSSQGKVLHVDARGLDLLLQSDPNLLLIDVREPDELSGPLGKILQSRNVSMQEIEENPEQFPRDKTLVLICRSGHRSLVAADLLAEHGYVVYTVDGGMQSWRKLHSQTSPPEKGGFPNAPNAPVHKPGTGKPTPREKGDQHSPEEFFDSNMGC